MRSGISESTIALHSLSWGDGPAVLALHPTGEDVSAFDEIGPALAGRGLRTVAVDLPGFGGSPHLAPPLTPRRLAGPVVEMARAMDEAPALLGVSMGARVAIEAGLIAPDVFRSLAAFAPFLPWRRFRWALELARAIRPDVVETLPFDRVSGLLGGLGDWLERHPGIQERVGGRAAGRAIHVALRPSERASVVSSMREMALDPAFGPEGLWLRLRGLALPAAFFWGARDRVVPPGFAQRVAEVVPQARHVMLPCLGHHARGKHLPCLIAVLAKSLGANTPGSNSAVNLQRGPTGGSRDRIEIARCRMEGEA